MPNGRCGDPQTITGDAAEAVAGEREHEPFRRASTAFRYCPAADFGIMQPFAPRPTELRLDAFPQLVAPFADSCQRTAAHAQVVHTHGRCVLQVPGTSGDTLPAVNHQEVP